MLTANIVLTVPALPQSGIWFANSQAWTNYWQSVGGEVNFNPANTNLYAPIDDVDTQAVVNFQVDGVDNQVPSIAMFNALLLAYRNLDASYQLLRTELRDAGFITNSQ